MARLRAEQKARHSRFGDTIFLLEPDLKNGPGGMRDLCVGRWAAMARFGTCDPQRAAGPGRDDRAAGAGVHGGDASGCCACASPMHATAGRRQDHLRFALQEAIAPILYPEARDRGGVIRPAVHPAVEALMHQYHAHAKLIRNETERLLQRATRARRPAAHDRAGDAARRGRPGGRPAASWCATARWSRSTTGSSSASRRR